MKKKLPALILCLVICLCFALTSCSFGANPPSNNGAGGGAGDDHTHTDANRDFVCDGCAEKLESPAQSLIPTETIHSFLLNTINPTPTSLSQHISFEVEGDYEGQLNNGKGLIITKEITQAIIEEGSNEPVDIIIWRVYNMNSGNIVYSTSINLNPLFEGDIASVVIVPNGHEYDGLKTPENFFVVFKRMNNGLTKITVSSLDGLASEEVTVSDKQDGKVYEAVKFYEGQTTHFTIGSKLYRVQSDGMPYVTDIDYSGIREVLGEGYTVYKNGSYVYYGNLLKDYGASHDIVIFDNELEEVNYIQCPTFSAYANIKITPYVLSSGNVLIVTENKIPVSNLVAGTEYDYVVDDSAINVKTFLVNISTGQINEISDLPLWDYAIFSEPSATEKTLASGIDNIISGKKIVDGKFTDTEVKYVLTNDGALKKLILDIDEASAATAERHGDVYIVTLPYGTYVYSTTGERVGALPKDIEYENSKWFIRDGAIYAFTTLEKIYDIPEDMTFEKLTAASAVLSEIKTVDEVETKIYYSYDGTALTEIFRKATSNENDEIVIEDLYFYTKIYHEAEGEWAHEVLGSKGNVLVSLIDSTIGAKNIEITLVYSDSERLVFEEKTTTIGAVSTVEYKCHSIY